jgi:hypothetical protein
MSRRTVALIAACCALLAMLGGALLVGEAQHRAEASVIHILVQKGVAADPQAVRAEELLLTRAYLSQSLHTGATLARPNVTMDATGTTTTNPLFYPNYVLLFASRYSWHMQPAALPIGAGLAMLIGTLFTAAARWRPRVKAAP